MNCLSFLRFVKQIFSYNWPKTTQNIINNNLRFANKINKIDTNSRLFRIKNRKLKISRLKSIKTNELKPRMIFKQFQFKDYSDDVEFYNLKALEFDTKKFYANFEKDVL